jgi:hypothetical protein
MKLVRYVGPDIVISKDHSISRWRGKTALKSGKIYELEYDWDGIKNLNNHWVFYIFDDLNANEFGSEDIAQGRGYEINISNIQTIREYNLEKIFE